jgi:hypothetical protein
MTDQHTITPPPKLVEWLQDLGNLDAIALAYQAGADQELEACCEYLVRCAQWEPEDVDELRAARRPKPPSLKELALAALKRQKVRSVPSLIATEDCDTIRKALEQLDD